MGKIVFLKIVFYFENRKYYCILYFQKLFKTILPITVGLYRYLYSASHGVSQTEALSVHFSSRKKVRLKAREMRKGEQRE